MFGTPLLGGAIWIWDAMGGGVQDDYPQSFPNAEAKQRFLWCESNLVKVYQKHNKPEKINGVPALCVKYAGKERALLRKVVDKYEKEDD